MPEIKHFVTIKAPAEKVYRAITEQDGLAGWWTRDLKPKPEIGFTMNSILVKSISTK